MKIVREKSGGWGAIKCDTGMTEPNSKPTDEGHVVIEGRHGIWWKERRVG
ncbi:uncharacterized protein G2W53_000134 [Senna tora]|uniref:Uncharacterized protein n=1 Tax=Senna tora TaxID=362788 RepID=A0A834XF46_9FABA|nr:uncharacterized protein G2W53_000134 [Senna tora]